MLRARSFPLSRNSHRLPKARTTRLTTQDVHGEVLVYDLDRHNAHCLNESAARIWRRCDGRSSIEDLAGLLPRNGGTDEARTSAVWLALEDLSRRNLLEERVTRPPALASVSRREMVRRVGLVMAAAVPVITTLVAPTAADADSCLGPGAACTSSAQCCSGLCATNSCA